MGTEITLTGSGFGWKQGEVLIGAEKCKLLTWSNTEITCEVFKPQRHDEYVITVLPQGDKKPAAPMTFSYFFMQAASYYSRGGGSGRGYRYDRGEVLWR